MNYPNNEQFLAALFGQDAPWVHVTDFTYDPNHIPKERHLAAWKGDYFSRYRFHPVSNQYFTISNFYCDEKGDARRRKALYRHTPVIVLDDVKEKLSMAEVSKLPAPAWILETSPGSEQWGYILDHPCAERYRIENLLDGLVANGLAPEGRDPGMKGVTRYVRLPDGYNNKHSKLVNGQPFKCRMALWQPFNRVTLEQLAAPFNVDLEAVRRETRVDGAAAVDDHPLLNIPDIIHIKEVRSDGRFDITCPWVDEHTGSDDSGAAIFTNGDGTIGFKCHHGACQHRTGRNLLQFIDREVTGFSATFNNWKVMRELQKIAPVSFLEAPKTSSSITNQVASGQIVSFMETPIKQAPISFVEVVPETPIVVIQSPPAPPATPVPAQPTIDGLQLMVDALHRERPSSPEARELSGNLLKHVDGLPKIDQKHWHEVVCDLMHWSKVDLKEILRDLRLQWYGERVSSAEFYDNVLFVKELNQFYDFRARMFFSTDAFQNSFSHEDAEARKIALQDGRVKKVDRLDYAPKSPRVFQENGVVFGNTYVEDNSAVGVPGDASNWVNHFIAMGWGDSYKHILQYMAFTLRHPEIKINHMMILGSGEGTGKDFLLYPLLKAMGHNSQIISGEELLSDFNDYLLSTKYLHINEAELGDRSEAMAVSNRLKPIATAPPETLRVNQKGVKPIKIRNIISSTMTTNSQLPVRLNGASRRFFCLWSELQVRDINHNMLPEWRDYWNKMWPWMLNGGYQHCIHYLQHEVDLSDFNPGTAPPMTDFLRDIIDASKSPAVQTMENLIRKQLGVFKSDLVRADDVIETVRAGAMVYPNDVFIDSKGLTTIRVAQILNTIVSIAKLNVYYNGEYQRVWAVRETTRYKSMTPAELNVEYERQMKIARTGVVLSVVPRI